MVWKGRALSCGKFGDRFPSTLLYPGQTDIYSKGEGGFVINPSGVAILCSYDHDGLTMKPEKLCHPPGVSNTCIPGCGTERCPEDKFWRCAYPADRLQLMMESHQARTGRAKDHNEVVLNADVWVSNLPRTIEAIFYLQSSNDAYRQRAEGVHSAFLDAYGVTAAITPLVLFDPSRWPNAMFSCVRCM
mmetsp:Transcript_47401/g.106896  ORF Transcript_47401/g.106896 Transcript_47401/m.106896 type:complete len:188 (-) Transcript_47401:158-721(-)